MTTAAVACFRSGLGVAAAGRGRVVRSSPSPALFQGRAIQERCNPEPLKTGVLHSRCLSCFITLEVSPLQNNHYLSHDQIELDCAAFSTPTLFTDRTIQGDWIP